LRSFLVGGRAFSDEPGVVERPGATEKGSGVAEGVGVAEEGGVAGEESVPDYTFNAPNAMSKLGTGKGLLQQLGQTVLALKPHRTF
jgi:hypothetical protein